MWSVSVLIYIEPWANELCLFNLINVVVNRFFPHLSTDRLYVEATVSVGIEACSSNKHSNEISH